MSRQIYYNAAITIPSDAVADPHLRPSFPLADRLRRACWNACWIVLFRPAPRPFHAWRSCLLRLFGARLGPHCHISPAAKIWAPWNLICDDQVAIADGAEIYNPAPMHFGSHAIVSQGALLCGATHDYNDPAFPLIAYAMEVGAYAWICARACLCPGVNVGEGAVLGLASVATHDLEPWTVYAGVPAIKVNQRQQPTASVSGRTADQGSTNPR